MGKRPAKKSNYGIVGTIGAAALGMVAGAAAIFLSNKDNRAMVKNKVDSTVKKGKIELKKVEMKVAKAKKTLKKK